MGNLRDAACEYALRGWSVLPLTTREKRPDPHLVPHGKNDSSADLATVFGWWRASPDANVGLNCEASGFVVLDVDPRNCGDDTLYVLITDLGKLPITVESFTGGGGQHILFKHPGGSFRASLGPGLDIKDAGYIVAPPSMHPSGRAYTWSVDGDPAEVELADLPEAWLSRMRRPVATEPRQLNDDTDDDLRRIPAQVYVEKLTGRSADFCGWLTCPFHKDGHERTPSFKVEGSLWSCFGACEPLNGQQVLGGNVYTLAGLLWGYAMPLGGSDFMECRERLRAVLL